MDLNRAELSAWEASGFSPEEAAAWTKAGVGSPADAEQWTLLGCTPKDAARWAAAGVTSAVEVERWGALGCKAATAGRWRAEGFTRPHAARWIEVGIKDPVSARAAVRKGVAPTHIKEWTDQGMPAEWVAAWRTAGFKDRAVAVRWGSGGGFAPDEAMQWIDAGFSDPRGAARWRTAVGSASAAKRWRENLCTPDEARYWLNRLIDPDDVGGWRSSGWSDSFIEVWIRAGVRSAGQARVFLDHRLNSSDVARLIESGIDASAIVSWLRAGWSGSRAALIGADVVAGQWADSEVPVEEYWRWVPAFGRAGSLAGEWWRSGAALEELRSLMGGSIDIAALRSWESVGAEPSAVLEVLRDAAERSAGVGLQGRSGSPTGRAEMPEAPVPGSDLRAWTERGAVWFESAGLAPGFSDPFLWTLYSSGLDWAPLDRTLFWVWPGREWLEEILAWAEALTPHLRKVPDWPVTFHHDRFTIVLGGDSDWVRAWVGVEGTGVLVSFRHADFEVRKLAGDGDAELALGLALSWYLDLRASGDAPSASDFFREQVDSGNVSSRRRGRLFEAARAFGDVEQDITIGGSAPPRVHRVMGHVRTLDDARLPTEEARDRAPAWQRLTMGPHDTWVRAHHRGSTPSVQPILNYMRRSSALATFVGLAEREN